MPEDVITTQSDVIKPRKRKDYDWMMAFDLYLKGASCKDIAIAIGASRGVVTAHCTRNNWSKLREQSKFKASAIVKRVINNHRERAKRWLDKGQTVIEEQVQMVQDARPTTIKDLNELTRATLNHIQAGMQVFGLDKLQPEHSTTFDTDACINIGGAEPIEAQQVEYDPTTGLPK